MGWELTIISLSAISGLLCLWKELVRPNRARRAGRLVAVILGTVALACLGVNVTYQRHQPSLPATQAGFVTQGYSADSLNQYDSMPFFTEDDTTYRHADRGQISLVSNLPYFIATHPDIQQLHIFGYGPADPSALRRSAHRQFRFHPGREPSGTVSVSWSQHLTAGEPLHVYGRYQNHRSQPVRLILEGLNTRLDSVELRKQQPSSFHLEAVPKHLGKAVYSLLALSGTDTLQHEPVPVLVHPRTPLRVLILNAAPDFETKFLKNWLYENGQAVAVRNKISQDLYSQEFLNMDQLSLKRWNENTLENFDLFIVDQATLQTLTPAESQLLQQQVGQGRGLLIRNPGTSLIAPWNKNVRLQEEPVQSAHPMNVRFLGATDTAITLRAAQSWHVKPSAHAQSLAQNDDGQVLVASSLYGQGKFVLTTLTGTQQLVLKGQGGNFARLWTTLINAALAPQSVSQITVSTNIPVVHHASLVTVQSPSPLPGIRLEEAPVYLSQDVGLPFQGTGTFWPQHSGWNYWTRADQDTTYFYVFEEQDWQPVRQTERIAQTVQAISAGEQVVERDRDDEKSAVVVPKIYFFLVFLVCCSFLWWENKIS